MTSKFELFDKSEPSVGQSSQNTKLPLFLNFGYIGTFGNFGHFAILERVSAHTQRRLFEGFCVWVISKCPKFLKVPKCPKYPKYPKMGERNLGNFGGISGVST